LPPINRVHPIPNTDAPRELPTRHISTRKGTGNLTPPTTAQSLPTRARHRIVTQQAINALTIQEQVSMDTTFIPNALRKHHVQQAAPTLEHYANPMVHPITGKTISSYKKLMKDPAIAEVWQTAFEKEFRGMAQGDNKTGQKGMNAMFVMNHDDIKKILKAGKNSLTQTQWLITVLKKKTQTGFESQRVATLLTAMENYWSQQPTSTRQNYIGIAW
jgi:hypothetical protein